MIKLRTLTEEKRERKEANDAFISEILAKDSRFKKVDTAIKNCKELKSEVRVKGINPTLKTIIRICKNELQKSDLSVEDFLEWVNDSCTEDVLTPLALDYADKLPLEVILNLTITDPEMDSLLLKLGKKYNYINADGTDAYDSKVKVSPRSLLVSILTADSADKDKLTDPFETKISKLEDKKEKIKKEIAAEKQKESPNTNIIKKGEDELVVIDTDLKQLEEPLSAARKKGLEVTAELKNKMVKDLAKFYYSGVVESITESFDTDSYADKAWKLNRLVMSLNNEEAYYGTWLYTWPDGESKEDCEYDFGEEDSYNELQDLFIDVYKNYSADGLYTRDADVIQLAKFWDNKLGLNTKNVANIKEDLEPETTVNATPEVEVQATQNAFTDVVTAVTQKEWDLTTEINSIIATLDYSYSESNKEDIKKILNDIVNDTLVNIGMLHKVSELINPEGMQLLNTGIQKANDVLNN